MTVMLDILVEHLEEIEFLWAQRSAAVKAADYRFHEILELDDRIDAHLQGLLVGGDQCVQFAEPMLVDEDRFVAFAGCWCLARLGIFQPILDSLEECNLDAVADALCHADVGSIRNELIAAYSDGTPHIASAIALVLATHDIPVQPDRVEEFVCDDDAQVRRRGWLIASRMNDAKESR